jgi:hypothetical protein
MTFASKSAPALQALPGGRSTNKEYPNRSVERGPVESLLLRIAGADINLLSRPECSHEKGKFIVSGWLLLLAGMLAGISAAFALDRIFHNLITALAFGALWGFFSFNVDRLLVISMRKSRGKPGASLGQRIGVVLRGIVLAVPRLLLAGMLALTVSKPLELKIFESEIDFQLKADANRDRATHAREAVGSFPEIAQLESEKDSLQKRMDEARHNRDEAYQAAMEEAEGLAGNLKGLGPLYKVKNAFLATRAEELDAVLTRSRARIGDIDRGLVDLRADRDRAISAVGKAQEKAHGLLASLHALDEIAADPRSGHTLLIAIMFVNALFWIVDITPILIKLLAPFSVYDAVLESREMAAMAHCSTGVPTGSVSNFTDALTRRMEEETAHISRLDRQVLEFEEELFSRALAKLRDTAEFGESEDAIGSEVLSRLRHRLSCLSKK